MRDKEIGQAQLFLQVVQQVDHLGLNGHVQRGDGLVADNEFGLDGQSPGNADSLALAAGKLMGEPAGMLPVQTHQLQQLIDALPALLGIIHLVNDHAFLDNGGNRHSGIQGGVGILEDDLRLFGIVEAVRSLFQVYIFTFIGNFTLGRGINPHSHTAQGGLSAAGFSHQAHGFALHNVKGHVVHGFQDTAGNLKILADSIQSNQLFCQFLRHPLCPPFPPGWGSPHGAASRRHNVRRQP